MLDIRRLIKNYDDSARSFAELVPWMGLVAPGIVLNKDGSLLAVYRCAGIDAEGVEQRDIDNASQTAEHAMRVFDERFTLWWQVDRRRTSQFPGGTFDDPVSRFVDNVYREHFINAGQFQNSHYFAVLFTPPTGIEGLMDNVSYYVRNEGLSPLKALGQAAANRLFRRNAFSYEMVQLESFIDEFAGRLGSFDQTVSDIGLSQLTGEELLGYLHRRASPTSSNERVNIPRVPLYFDNYLPSDQLVGRRDSLHFKGAEGERFVAGVSIKDWPDFTVPGLLDSLLSIPAELTISQVMRLSNYDAARKFIADVERHQRNASKSFTTYAVEAMTKTESQKVDAGKMALAQDANDALTEMTTHGRVYGHYNLTVLAYAGSEVEADATVSAISRILNRLSYIAVRETMHLLSAFAGTLPGQAGALVRWSMVSTSNLADLAPLRTLHVGDPINRYFTEQYGSAEYPVASLTALSTELSTPFLFNFHVGDLPHTLVIGPSRTGKSTFNNFLISQWQKYAPCHTFIFDKDYSCRIPTILQGGTHVDMAGDHGREIKLNPMLLLETEEGRAWLAKWLEIPLTSRKYELSAADDKKIWTALEQLAAQPRSNWRLQNLISLLPMHLSEQLEQWVGNGQRARYFDNEEDTFALGHFTCVEMGGLFQDEHVARAFMEYAFFRITQRLDGRPALIYIEEAWFMLAEPRFAARINDWLRTLAKKNAMLLMATQSLDEVAKSEIFATIIDNIPNKIFLPNDAAYAHYDLYKEKFGLNAAQIDRIKTAERKVNYYIVTPGLSRMAAVRFPPEILAVLRSDAKAQKVFNRHYASGKEDWIHNYVEEMVNGTI